MISRPVRVLAVMDGYRVTGPARQLLAAASSRQSWAIATRLAIFQRPSAPTPLVRTAILSGVPVHVVRDRFPGDPCTVLSLLTLVRKTNVRVLQTHGYKANVFGCLIARAVRQPWVAFLHGETWESWKVRAYFALERVAVRHAERVIVVSHHMARRAVDSGIPAAKIQVVHNACLVEHELNVSETSPNSPPIVGVIGRLSPEKGVDVALRAHYLVVQRRNDARLLIAGEGPERARLQRDAERLGIGASVRWLAYQEDITQLYRRLAVLVIPSRSEGLPNVALEAMAHGVPVVASAVGGLPEVIADGENGLLAPPENPAELARKILLVLEDRTLCESLARRGREVVASRFSLDARVRALSEVYGRLAA